MGKIRKIFRHNTIGVDTISSPHPKPFYTVVNGVGMEKAFHDSSRQGTTDYHNTFNFHVSASPTGTVPYGTSIWFSNVTVGIRFTFRGHVHAMRKMAWQQRKLLIDYSIPFPFPFERTITLV
mmetsp:Transcript_23584/g.65451  ORF Transcript_23584/g.65451 Transcript_23584/m.65451 type:complete len:122 (+) Transcript_23584:124-489(+)